MSIGSIPARAETITHSFGWPELHMCALRSVRYRIIHAPAFDLDSTALADVVQGRRVLMVVDKSVHELYESRIAAYSRQFLNVAATVLVDGCEAEKTWLQVEHICESAMACGLERNAVIICVGGGVALDTAGFAASIYRRGVPYLRIPTTLIGLVDVSVGVKQGVNFGGSKNILGSFYPPIASINDVSFLRTLPAVHIAGGVAEILKMAILRDSRLFNLVEAHAPALLASFFQQPASIANEVLWRAEQAMLNELEGNLFEINLQRLVDFGHTFSPALESASDYALPHGHAVAVDILISSHIAVARGLCHSSVLDRTLAIFKVFDLPASQRFCSAASLHQSLQSVRAHRGGDLNLVVPTGIGSAAFLSHVTAAEIQSALEFLARTETLSCRR